MGSFTREWRSMCACIHTQASDLYHIHGLHDLHLRERDLVTLVHPFACLWIVLPIMLNKIEMQRHDSCNRKVGTAWQCWRYVLLLWIGCPLKTYEPSTWLDADNISVRHRVSRRQPIAHPHVVVYTPTPLAGRFDSGCPHLSYNHFRLFRQRQHLSFHCDLEAVLKPWSEESFKTLV